MTTAGRPGQLAAFVIVIALLAIACAPAGGPLGTPTGPAATPGTSGEPVPSDVAPASPSDAAPASPDASPSDAPATPTPSVTPAQTPSATPAGSMIVRAYFVLGSFTDDAGLVPVLREVPETRAVARAAMTALLAGPKGAELETSPAMYTGIPAGVRLLDLAVADAQATVVLSGEWSDAAASFQEGMATAQVVYTLTQFPTIDRVRIRVEDGPASGAVDRSDFRVPGLLPAIFVDRPAWGAAAGNPMRLSGIANVFEAQFMVQVLDGRGHVLAEEPVMATCGTGCWGTFKADIAYEVGKAQYGTLRVFEPSARDGSPTKVTEYRVWLTP